MVLIFLSWLYILFSSLTFGIGFSKLFRIPSIDVVITSILGLFSITIVASIWAVFGPINIAFHSVLLLFTLLIGFWNKELYLVIFQKTKSIFIAFPIAIKMLLLFSSLLILAQSATSPFIIDNETYYIQTIKWLNEYGFVPGLANLHLFFGQTSGWHITQSVYSFSFLYDRFNDLSGFCLLIGNYWAFEKLHSYFVTKNKIELVFGLLPITYVFLFQFVNAPSPDVPVYIFGLILFWLYLENENFAIITSITLFLVFIKITAVVLLILPILLVIKNYDVIKKQLNRIVLLSVLVFVLFIIKNAILTGYPFFPMTFISLPNASFTIPKAIMDFFFSQRMMHSFYIPSGSIENLTLTDILQHYFFRNGINSIIGIATIVMVIASPIVIYKRYPKQTIWNIYFVFITLLILVTFSSPQYRFYVYFTIFFGLLLLSLVLTNRKIILISIGLSLALVAFLIFIPISFAGLTNNTSLVSNSTFSIKNTLVPEPNTKGNQKYVLLPKENLDYYSPTHYPFFWITGNGDLPCVNTEQLRYFETNFKVIPQLRGASLKDGFYAKKIQSND